MPPLPSVSDVQTYLGISGDSAIITERLTAAIGMAERDTGRTIASGSNSTTIYSSNNDSVLRIHDRPYVDATRVVTWNGVTLTEDTDAWFLPDRRDSNLTTSLQLRAFNTVGQWYKADPQWFDKNLDRASYGAGTPNDVKITGIIGMPFPKSDVTGAILVLTAFLYWRAKSGASGTAYDLNGETFSLEETPPEYRRFVADWRVRSAVASVG